MKFLSELVSCCCISSNKVDNVGNKYAVLKPAGSVKRNMYRRRRWRAVAEWKPTLTSILEDDVVAMPEEENEGSEDIVKGKVGRDLSSSARDIASLPGFIDDDYRPNQSRTILPSLSPTPFMI